ncbi:MAG: AIR synthase [Lachnospiraceae bacterium]|nr:AIR synthase [Lachnospiraceae bacterium]
MTGYAGASGTVREACSKAEILSARFSPSYIDRIMHIPVMNGEKQETVDGIISRSVEAGAEVIYNLKAGDGGIYAALWQLGESLNSGFAVRHKDIPILQETIEVCNLLDINPYMLESGDCMLMVTDAPSKLTEEMNRAGIPAADIGNLTTERKRAIINGENERYLNRPETEISSNRGLQNGQHT